MTPTDNNNQILKAMSLEQLWQLFPIELTDHNPRWAVMATEEIDRLMSVLHYFYPVITHIGSTAIGGIKAKPIVDILVEVVPDALIQELIGVMETNGYICTSTHGRRLTFVKGYTPGGYAREVFHIHIHPLGDNDAIFFRDYLKEHPEAAREYESLKLSLLPQFTNDRDGYTEAKAPFIKKILKMKNTYTEF